MRARARKMSSSPARGRACRPLAFGAVPRSRPSAQTVCGFTLCRSVASRPKLVLVAHLTTKQNRPPAAANERTDPIHNFMDYSPDTCLTHLTPGARQALGSKSNPLPSNDWVKRLGQTTGSNGLVKRPRKDCAPRACPVPLLNHSLAHAHAPHRAARFVFAGQAARMVKMWTTYRLGY